MTTTRGVERAENILRVLHGFIGDVKRSSLSLTAYVRMLRVIREELHPIGADDIRMVETPEGIRFRVTLGDRHGADFYYGYHAERDDAQVLLALIQPGATAIDAGANFGFYTVSAGLATGPTGVVEAFEPDPDAAKLLTENVTLNKLENVHIHPVCLGGEDGDAVFHVMEESAFSSLVATERARLRDTVRVPVRRLDSILEERGVTRVDVLKIDVEGYEFGVLEGSRRTLERSPDIVIMLEVSAKNLDEDRRGRLETELRALVAEGFRGWVVERDDQGERRVRIAESITAFHSANVFLVREGSSAETRLVSVAGTRVRDDRDWPVEAVQAVQARDATLAVLSAQLDARQRELQDLTGRLEVRIGNRIRRARPRVKHA